MYMDMDSLIVCFILFVIGCVIIYVIQHRDSFFGKKDNSDVSDVFNSEKLSYDDFDRKYIHSSKNYLLVNSLFFTDNYFDFEKFVDFVMNISDGSLGHSDAFSTLSLLKLLIEMSTSLQNDFKNQLFFSKRQPIPIEEVKKKIEEGSYTGTVADFYEILISVVAYLKQFLM